MTLCAVLAKRGFLPQWLSGLNSLGKMGWGSIVVLSSVSAFPLIGGLVFYYLWKSSRHLFLKVEASKKLADRFQVGEYAIFYDEDENIAVAAFAGDVRLNAPPSACAIPRHYSLEQGVMRFPEEMRQRQLTLEEIQQRL